MISAVCVYCGAISPAYEGARRVACACNQPPSLLPAGRLPYATTKQLVNANGTATGTTPHLQARLDALAAAIGPRLARDLGQRRKPRKNGAAQVD